MAVTIVTFGLLLLPKPAAACSCAGTPSTSRSALERSRLSWSRGEEPFKVGDWILAVTDEQAVEA
jgi:hypothetical protein